MHLHRPDSAIHSREHCCDLTDWPHGSRQLGVHYHNDLTHSKVSHTVPPLLSELEAWKVSKYKLAPEQAQAVVVHAAQAEVAYAAFAEAPDGLVGPKAGNLGSKPLVQGEAEV